MIKVCCAVIIHNGKLLICKRANYKSNAGRWEFPGGKIKAGETAEDCIMRELKEELNIEIIPINQLHSFTDSKIELIPFICKGFSGEIRMLDHSECKWINLEQLPLYNLTPADIELCTYLFKHPELIGDS